MGSVCPLSGRASCSRSCSPFLTLPLQTARWAVGVNLHWEGEPVPSGSAAEPGAGRARKLLGRWAAVPGTPQTGAEAWLPQKTEGEVAVVPPASAPSWGWGVWSRPLSPVLYYILLPTLCRSKDKPCSYFMDGRPEAQRTDNALWGTVTHIT